MEWGGNKTIFGREMICLSYLALGIALSANKLVLFVAVMLLSGLPRMHTLQSESNRLMHSPSSVLWLHMANVSWCLHIQNLVLKFKALAIS